MEKIKKQIQNTYRTYLLTQKERLLNDKNFLESFGPVFLEIQKHTVTKKVERKKAQLYKELSPLYLQTLTDSAYETIMTEDKVNQIIKKYTLKRKAILQSKKRAQKHDKKDITPFDQRIEATHVTEKEHIDLIKKPHQRTYGPDVLERHQQIYQIEKQKVEQTLDDFRNELLKGVQKKHQTLDLKHQKKLKKVMLTLNQIKHKIKSLDTFDKSTLDIKDDAHLVIKNLTMKFGGLTAVNDLSFTVKKGEIFGLIGPNGAGKTTVFNCITQFYKSSAGDIYYQDQMNEVHDLNKYKVHNVIKYGISRTFQNVEMVWELNVLDNMLVGSHSVYRTGFFAHVFHTKLLKHEEELNRAKAIKILTDLDIVHYMYMYPMGLPYGVLKKIELARTLMTNPQLIILDEPAAGLNDQETNELALFIRKIQKDYGCTIFLVEHDMGLVMEICDTICAISFGKKLAIGTPQDIQSNKDVQTAYLGGE